MADQPMNTEQTQRSLWLGDLAPWMDEAFLFNLFVGTGQLVSVKLIRSVISEIGGRTESVPRCIPRITQAVRASLLVAPIVSAVQESSQGSQGWQPGVYLLGMSQLLSPAGRRSAGFPALAITGLSGEEAAAKS